MKKFVVGSIVLMFVTLGWGGISWGEQPTAPRGELRIVGPNWADIAFNVWDHLVELDQHGKQVPRLATAWRWLDDRTLEVTLRRGVTFQNGEIFDAEIVKLNWKDYLQLGQPHKVGSFMNFKPGSRLEIIDPYTVRFRFPEPDGGVLLKFNMMHIANRQFYRELGWGEKSW